MVAPYTLRWEKELQQAGSGFHGNLKLFYCHFCNVLLIQESRVGFCNVYVRFEVHTAVTMKNVILLDINTQFVPHRNHITCPLQNPAH
jgi:hypothetical protein